MDFAVNSRDLTILLSRVASAAAAKSPQTILQTVMLRAAGDRLHARATDHYVGMESSCPAAIKAEGELCIEARRALEIAKALPAGDVKVKLGKTQLELSAGKSKFRIAHVPTDEFPNMPELGAAQFASIPASTLASLLAQGSYAVGHDDSRPQLTGVLLEMEGSDLRAITLDGSRAAVAHRPVEQPMPPVLLPGRALAELRKLCDNTRDGSIEVAVVGPHAFFRAPCCMLTVKLLEATFPPYRRLQSKAEHKTTVLRTAFIEAVKRAALGAPPTEGPVVRLKFSPGSLLVSSISGDAEDLVECVCDADVDAIEAVPKYLLEAANSITDDELHIGVTNAKDPILFQASDCYAIVMTIMKGRT